MKKNRDIAIYIFAAGNIKNKIHFLNYAFNSPALVPINTSTASANIIEYYKEMIPNCKIHLVINDTDLNEVKNELEYYLEDIDLITVPLTNGINETIKVVLNLLNIDCDIIINPVTSIPTETPKQDEVFLSRATFQNADFSLVSLENKQLKFFTKGKLPLEKAHAFTGVFRTSLNVIKKSLFSCNNDTDLLMLIQIISSFHSLTFKKVNWIDCGHENNFYEAKAKLITSRSFNAIKIFQEKGLLEKRSKNVTKFKDEIDYLTLLPREIQVFFPRVISNSVLDELASAKLEYYGYPTMAEYMLYWDISNGMWEKAFKSLIYPLQEFKKHPFSIGNNAYNDFYISKLQNRLKDFKAQLNEKDVFLLEDDYLYVNGKKLKNYSLLEEQIIKKTHSLYNENDFCIMHGDYCFNNILYDYKSGIIKLIDARGAFGKGCKGIYGDFKYDLAKLTHSVTGQYDYFIAKLFTFNIQDKAVFYSVNQRANYKLLVHLNKKLVEDFGYSFDDILFLASLLFLSMPPLHNEDPSRQKALYVHGLVIINQLIGE